MKIAFYDAHRFEKNVFDRENKQFNHEITYFEARLTKQSVNMALGYPVVCAFVNDSLDEETLRVLAESGTKLIALRSAGFNHVDLEAADRLGLKVVRVPEYSPYAVAEHAVALILTLNRKIHRAHNRVREGNFSLDGLVGFDLHRKTVGVVGTGRIGSAFSRIMMGFGCHVLAYDNKPDVELQSLGVRYVEKAELFRSSDIISLHVPLTPTTRHLVDDATLALTKPGVMLINTGRGALIDTQALIRSLKSNHIGYAGLDVYEEEEGIFFQNLSDQVLQDDQLARLLTFPNVILTSHQAFLTDEALQNIAATTLQNISDFGQNRNLVNEVRAAERLKK